MMLLEDFHAYINGLPNRMYQVSAKRYGARVMFKRCEDKWEVMRTVAVLLDQGYGTDSIVISGDLEDAAHRQ